MFQTLISAQQLSDCYLQETKLCVVDCSFDLSNTQRGQQDYLLRHLPGAFYANLDTQLSSPIVEGKTGRHPLPSKEGLLNLLRSWGMHSDTQLVAYDNAGGAIAGRLWWLSKWLGHKNCAVLDGGIQAWMKAGLPTEATLPNAISVGSISLMSSLAEYVSAQQIVESDYNYRLIDVRDPGRYSGQSEPIDPIAGHIPTAICRPFQKHWDSNQMFLKPSELKAMYADYADDAKNNRLVFYCGSGVTAAHSILAISHAGYVLPLLYAGSWSDWITDPLRKIELSEAL